MATIQQMGRQVNMWVMLKALATNGIGPFVNAGAPVNGASGTLVNYAGPGALLVDITNKFLYINTNTKASPTWTKVGTQA